MGMGKRFNVQFHHISSLHHLVKSASRKTADSASHYEAGPLASVLTGFAEEVPACSDAGCAVLVLMWKRSLSRSESFARLRVSSSVLADAPACVCSVLICRRASMRSSTGACRKRARSKNRERLRVVLELSPASLPSAPRGGASAVSSPG